MYFSLQRALSVSPGGCYSHTHGVWALIVLLVVREKEPPSPGEGSWSLGQCPLPSLASWACLYRTRVREVAHSPSLHPDYFPTSDVSDFTVSMSLVVPLACGLRSNR